MARSYNPDIPLWIAKSICQNIQNTYNAITSPGWLLYYEKQVRKTDTGDNFVEVRFDGPHFRQVSTQTALFDVGVNLLMQVLLTNDLYKQDKVKGQVQLLLPRNIEIFDTNGTSIGCLNMGQKEGIRSYVFGRAGDRQNLVQGALEAFYQLEMGDSTWA